MIHTDETTIERVGARGDGPPAIEVVELRKEFIRKEKAGRLRPSAAAACPRSRA